MVHIMMATYNGERYIAEQIESILKQTYIEWKLFIRDDGSKDSTVKIVQDYMKKHPMKIFLIESKIIYHDAKNNFAALYKEVPEADYYAFCDQDDIWKENKLEECIKCFQENDEQIPTIVYHDMQVGKNENAVIADSFFIYTKLQLDKKTPFQHTLVYNTIPGCAMLFNHKTKEVVSGIPQECNMHDWWILLSVLALGGNVVYCEKKLGLYRQHEANEIGAIRKTSGGRMLLKCFQIFRIKHYIEQNKVLKEERIRQTEALKEMLWDKISEKKQKIIDAYLELLKKRGFGAYNQATRNSLVFYSRIYTFKFYFW